MIDKTLLMTRLLYPEVARAEDELLKEMLRLGFEMRPTETVRSFQKQADFFAQGRTTDGQIITRAKEGLSYHHYGCAIDNCFRGHDPYPWALYNKVAKSLGFITGYEFHILKSDKPHIQMTFGMTPAQMLEVYEKGGIISVWSKFDESLGLRKDYSWLSRAKQVEEKLSE
jgi:hypothetical protein